MNNINPKLNPITTIAGIILLTISLGMFTAPMFVEIKQQLNYWIPGSIGIVGLCLLLIPDDLKGALRNFITKKSDTL